MSVNKKRKQEEGEAGSLMLLQQQGSGEAKSRKIKAANRASPLKSSTPFLDAKQSLWQQGMEELNDFFRPLFQQASTDEDVYFAALEYERNSAMIQQKFHPTAGQVVAMGSDDANQLGISASAEAEKECEYFPTLVRGIPKNAVHVACGAMHSVVLTDDGRVFTFGVNDDNALGRGEIDDDSLHLAASITKGFGQDQNSIVAIDAGDSHSLFLSLSGQVYQTGMYKDVDSGKFRDVPIGTNNDNPKGSNEYPTKIDLPKPIRKIAAGVSFNAAISNDGELYTWGMGHFGQLARSKNMGANIKPPTDGNQDAPAIYELGKMWIGEEYETGEYEKDQDGKTKLDDSGKPIPIISYRYFPKLIREKFLKPAPVCWAGTPYPKRNVLSVACGQLFIVAVARDAGYHTSVYSAGHNGYGQLGHGDKLERHELTVIKDLEQKLIKKVAAGESHALALDMTGNAVFAWGRSDYGQLGHTDQIKGGDQELSPVQIAFPKSIENVRIQDISAGSSVSMAITEEKDVYTWGFGESRATGQPGNDDITLPKKLNVLKKVYGKKSGDTTNCHVLEAAGGAQHSLMIIQRFA